MENKNKWIFGIALDDSEIDDCYKQMMKKEHDLSDEDIVKLKMAHLFRLSDNVQFNVYDADIVLWDGYNYYLTGDFEPMSGIENKDIVALSDEKGECENI